MKNHTKHKNKRRNNNSHTALEQFLHSAASRKLSAGAILLWQSVYFAAQRTGKKGSVTLRTAELTAALGITRNGLQKIRHALVNAGLLQVQVDAYRTVHYTLLLDGKAIDTDDNLHDHTVTDTNANTAQKKTKKSQSSENSGKPAKPYIPDEQYPGDILQKKTYLAVIKPFCAQLEGYGKSDLETSLQQFLHKRMKQGKTLTKAGLDAMLDKLAALAERDIRRMTQIVDQSIERGWSGFYPYKPRAAAAGSATSYHSGAAKPWEKKKPSLPYYDTKIEDLSFLER